MRRKEIIVLAGFIILKFFLQQILIDSGYDLHRDEFLHLDLETQYTHLIRIISRKVRESEFAETSQFFESSMIFDSITNEYAREYGTAVYIFRNSKVDINQIIEKEINEKKNFGY